MKSRLVKSLLFTFGFLALFVLCAEPLFAARGALWGQVASEMGTIGKESYGQSAAAPADVRTIIFRIINIILELLGVILVLLILYAGFLWMTAAGSEEKITKARKIITSAVVGLAIILSAYAITQFVASRLIAVTK